MLKYTFPFATLAIQPKDIEEFFSCVFAQAQELQQSYDACDESKKRSYRVPFVTVSIVAQHSQVLYIW